MHRKSRPTSPSRVQMTFRQTVEVSIPSATPTSLWVAPACFMASLMGLYVIAA